MKDAGFTIELGRGNLIVEVWGFWDRALQLQFSSAFRTHTDLMRSRGMRAFATLVDARRFSIQSAEVVDAIAKLQASNRSPTAGRTALIVSTSLLRLQAERVIVGDRVRTFSDKAAAEHWLATT